MWWVIASEIVIFGGLLASYVMHRLAHDAFAAQAAHTNTWIGAFNTFVLLTSSLSAVLAHKAAEHGDGKKAARLLYFTMPRRRHVPGREGVRVDPRDPRRASRSRRARSGRSTTRRRASTRLHVIAGMAIMMLRRARRAQENASCSASSTIGIYWHFVDIVWIFLFPLLYIAK